MHFGAATCFILFLVLPPVLWTLHHRQPEVIGSGLAFLVCVVGGWGLLYFGESLDSQASGRSGGWGLMAIMVIGAPISMAYCLLWLVVVKVVVAIRKKLRGDSQA